MLTITIVPAGIGDAAEFDILDSVAHGGEDDRAVAHELLDCLGASSGCWASRAHWSGWSHSTCTAAASWLRVVSVPAISRVAASMVSSSAVSRSPSSSARISSRDQVVGEVVAPLGDHVVDVGVELVAGRHDDRLVVGDVPVEDLEDVLGPVGEQLPVFAGSAEQRADDRNRVPACDVGDHVAVPRAGHRVDQFGDDVDDRGLQSCGRPWCERLADQSAQPMVFGAVQAQQARGGLVPQPSRRDALCRKHKSLRHAKPGIAQHSAHQLVAQHLGPVWPERDRPLQTGLPDEPVRLVGVLGVLVGDGRQPGIEDAWGCRCGWCRRSWWSSSGRRRVDYPTPRRQDHRPERVDIARPGVVYTRATGCNLRVCADVLPYAVRRMLASMSEIDPRADAPLVNWSELGVSELLPTGTVTLLLADVEGSTRLWETQPEQMTAAVARLDHAAVASSSPPMTGCARSSRVRATASWWRSRGPVDAVACALELQRAPLAPIRLRIGVHTGEVQLRDEGNYVGPTINRTARLRDLAHGGQTVLSGATEALVVDRLPADAWLTDLGTHALRDLPRPERVVQLCHPDLRQRVPAAAHVEKSLRRTIFRCSSPVSSAATRS